MSSHLLGTHFLVAAPPFANPPFQPAQQHRHVNVNLISRILRSCKVHRHQSSIMAKSSTASVGPMWCDLSGPP